MTYVKTRAGFVYAGFVIDVFSRRIVGWILSNLMRAEALLLQALNQAIRNAHSTINLIYHSDRGFQYVSLVYHERLTRAGISESAGSVGDSYDDALAENVNGSDKNELIHARSWDNVLEVEIAIFEWVTWWDMSRLHENLDYHTPQEIEEKYWCQHKSSPIMENRVNPRKQTQTTSIHEAIRSVGTRLI
ncbi:DDE-type integrase/transposase/recombinase [Arcanobacterium canis]|uniref:DDE-type integrase/transposase/recombinase n=1 Tax=Arcanobacterium canis TaxID=999183 RepID=A0ABY8G0T9_9ACTO|nr:DDE-type integrase/transposase/recombinase [Arcanobacterium canis]WFM84222.1 DDE-type integrase/transposase/recombinase [Arcanobacterium canis]